MGKYTDENGREIEERSWSRRPGKATTTLHRRVGKGLVQFDHFQVLDREKTKRETKRDPGNTSPLPFHFEWEDYDILDEDRPDTLGSDVLRDAGLTEGLGRQSIEKLIDQIKDRVGSEAWESYEVKLSELRSGNSSSTMVKVFLVAAWADLFEVSIGIQS